MFNMLLGASSLNKIISIALKFELWTIYHLLNTIGKEIGFINRILWWKNNCSDVNYKSGHRRLNLHRKCDIYKSWKQWGERIVNNTTRIVSIYVWLVALVTRPTVITMWQICWQRGRILVSTLFITCKASFFNMVQ